MAEKLADFKVEVDIDVDGSDNLAQVILDIAKGEKGFNHFVQAISKGVISADEALGILSEAHKKFAEDFKNGNTAAIASQLNLEKIIQQSKSPEGMEKLSKATEKADKNAEKLANTIVKGSQQAEKAAEKASQKYEKMAKKAVVFLGQYIALKKTFSAVMGFAKEGEELSRMAQLSGTSAGSIEKLGIALKNYGGSASSASSTLGKLNRQMEDLKFGKKNKLGQAAIQYGLDINAATPEDMLRNIAKRMEGMGALQQVNMGRMLGLDDATIMLLQQGLEGVNRELEKAGKLTVFSKEDIENATKMQRAYREFQERFEQLKATLNRGLLPVFQTLFERLSKLATYLKEHPKLLKTIGIAAAVAFGALTFWLHPILATIGLISAGIALLIDDWAHYKETGEGALKPLWENLDKLNKFIEEHGGWIAHLTSLVKLLGGAYITLKTIKLGTFIANLFKMTAAFTAQHTALLPYIAAILALAAAYKMASYAGEKFAEWLHGSREDYLKDYDAQTENLKERFGEHGEKAKDFFDELHKARGAIELGQNYVTQANGTALNGQTSTMMTMMNTNDSHNKSTNINIGTMNVKSDKPEEFGQTLFNSTQMTGFADAFEG